MFAFTFKEMVLAVLARMRLLNVVAKLPPIVWAMLLLNVTVAVPPVNAVAELLFSQLPFIERSKLFALSVPADKVRLPFNPVIAPMLTVIPVPFIMILL